MHAASTSASPGPGTSSRTSDNGCNLEVTPGAFQPSARMSPANRQVHAAKGPGRRRRSDPHLTDVRQILLRRASEMSS